MPIKCSSQTKGWRSHKWWLLWMSFNFLVTLRESSLSLCWVKSPTAGQDCFVSSGQYPILFPASSLLTLNCYTISAILIATAPGSGHIELIILVGTEKWALLTWAPHQLSLRKPTTKNQLNEWPLYKMSSLPRIYSLNLYIDCVFETRLPQAIAPPLAEAGPLLSSLCCVLGLAALSFWVILLSLLPVSL